MRRSFKHYEWPSVYYIWLCDMIDLETHSRYSNLISFLYDTEYTWSVPNDVNRATDGKYIRSDYIFTYDYDDGPWVYDSCSVLEMLIALARRICFDIMPEYDIGIAGWFWKFIDNLGLNRYDNSHFSGVNSDEIAVLKSELKIEKSLFSVKNFAKTDFSKMELWYKMQFWLAENYDF